MVCIYTSSKRVYFSISARDLRGYAFINHQKRFVDAKHVDLYMQCNIHQGENWHKISLLTQPFESYALAEVPTPCPSLPNALGSHASETMLHPDKSTYINKFWPDVTYSNQALYNPKKNSLSKVHEVCNQHSTNHMDKSILNLKNMCIQCHQ